MSKRTKALDIPPKVKRRVWERDEHCCILCGSPYAMPNAHFIPRGRGGLGITEKNVVTLCIVCHTNYDNGAGREKTEEEIRNYLKSQYPDWDESELYYKKWV